MCHQGTSEVPWESASSHPKLHTDPFELGPLVASQMPLQPVRTGWGRAVGPEQESSGPGLPPASLGGLAPPMAQFPLCVVGQWEQQCTTPLGVLRITQYSVTSFLARPTWDRHRPSPKAPTRLPTYGFRPVLPTATRGRSPMRQVTRESKPQQPQPGRQAPRPLHCTHSEVPVTSPAHHPVSGVAQFPCTAFYSGGTTGTGTYAMR